MSDISRSTIGIAGAVERAWGIETAYHTGIADVLYKRFFIPKWMNVEEKTHYIRGFNYGKAQIKR